MQTIKDTTSIVEVLRYIVASYGVEIYKEKQRLSNLIADLYTGEDRLKRLYRRMVVEDAVTQQLYAIFLKPIPEREAFYNRLVYLFKEANFYEEPFARQVLDAFLHGMNMLLVEPISTKATKEDGCWHDGYGVTYSADRKKLIRGNKELRDYKVKEGTVVICDEAFSWCGSLREITLPLSVTSIGNWAFGECLNLQRIEIPSSVTSIGDVAFVHCESLQSIELPSSVTSIGNYVFRCCSSLTSIKVDEGNMSYRDINGILFTKDLKRIICYPEGTRDEKYVIPSGVTSIGDEAFSDCNSLCEIEIPSGVTSIGDEAFFGCSNLRSIEIPSSVTNIGDSAFKDCKNLYKIKILSGVMSIGDGAFSGCSNLQNIEIPSSVTSIGNNAFSSCSSLQRIEIPSGVTSIGHYVFRWCPNLQQITIPTGILEKFKNLLHEV